MHIMLNNNSDVENMCPKCSDLLWLHSSQLKVAGYQLNKKSRS